MKPPILPFLNRSFLYPGESLSSLLMRLRKSNYYETKEAITGICRPYLPQPDKLPFPRHWSTFDVLSQLTQLSAEELYSASIHQFANVLTPPNSEMAYCGDKVKLDGVLVNDYLWTDSDVQYCPLCLVEGAYHRLVWTPIITAVCLKHHCLLVRKCYCCKANIGLEEIINAQCSTCDFALVDTPPVTVTQDKVGLLTQQILQSWLNPIETRLPDCQLPTAPPAVLFRVLTGFRKTIERIENTSELYTPLCEVTYPLQAVKARLQPAQVYVSYATAMTALMDWPNGFYNLLDTLRNNLPSDSYGQVQQELGQLYTVWLERNWRPEVFQFVQTAFDEYITDRYMLSPSILHLRRFKENPHLAQRMSYMTEAEAARILDVAPETIQKLAEQGKLLRYQDVEKDPFPQHFNLIRRADVMNLYSRWSGSDSLNKTAVALGLTPKVVLGLVKLGLLEAVRGPHVDKSQEWRIHRASVLKLSEAVQRKCIDQNDAQFLNLTQSAQSLSLYQYTIAKIIQTVLDGKLLAYWRGVLGKLEVNRDSILETGNLERAESEKISRQQLADQLGVKPHIITTWAKREVIRSGGITGEGEAMYFPSATVEDFAEKFVFADKAAEILGVNQLVVQKWARNGRLNPVSGPGKDELHQYLFRKQEVESLSPKNRLTAPQMAKILGLSRSQFFQWIKQGKVKPISGPGIDNCKHYLFTNPLG